MGPVLCGCPPDSPPAAAGPPRPARGPQSAPDPTGRGPGVAHTAWGPQSSSSAFQGRAARRVAGQDPWARVWGPLGVVGLPGPRSRAPWAPPPATSGKAGPRGHEREAACCPAGFPACAGFSVPKFVQTVGSGRPLPSSPACSVSVTRATVSCGCRGRRGVTAASDPAGCQQPSPAGPGQPGHRAAAELCDHGRPRAARAARTRCREGSRGGRKGYPGGPAGLTPSCVPRECQARTAGMACRDWTARRLVRRRRPRREGGLRSWASRASAPRPPISRRERPVATVPQERRVPTGCR